MAIVLPFVCVWIFFWILFSVNRRSGHASVGRFRGMHLIVINNLNQNDFVFSIEWCLKCFFFRFSFVGDV